MGVAPGSSAETPALRPEPWRWDLSPARYKALSLVERSYYDRAATCFRQQDFKAAAFEFERFSAELQDRAEPSILAYTGFMVGYCRHQAKERNQAVKSYQEVLDIFPGEVDAAAAAMYHQGLATSRTATCARGWKPSRG